MPPQARVGDHSSAPADTHGCPACPHPVMGPSISGSRNVLTNGLPSVRVGDHGVHSACCGPNIWNAKTGSRSVLINGRLAHRLGDAVNHCGGLGKTVQGSPNVLVGTLSNAIAQAKFTPSIRRTNSDTKIATVFREMSDWAELAVDYQHISSRAPVTIQYEVSSCYKKLFDLGLAIAKGVQALVKHGPFGVADSLGYLLPSLLPFFDRFPWIQKVIHRLRIVRRVIQIARHIPIVEYHLKLIKRALIMIFARPFITVNEAESCPVKVDVASVNLDINSSNNLNLNDLKPANYDGEVFDVTSYAADLLERFRPEVHQYAADVPPVDFRWLLTKSTVATVDNNGNQTLTDLHQHTPDDAASWFSSLFKLPPDLDAPKISHIIIDEEIPKSEFPTKGSVYAWAIYRNTKKPLEIELNYKFIRTTSRFLGLDGFEDIPEHQGDGEIVKVIVKQRSESDNEHSWHLCGIQFGRHKIGGSEQYCCGNSVSISAEVEKEVRKQLQGEYPAGEVPDEAKIRERVEEKLKEKESMQSPDTPPKIPARVSDLDPCRPKVFIARGSHAICPEPGYRHILSTGVLFDDYPPDDPTNIAEYNLILINEKFGNLTVKEVLFNGYNEKSQDEKSTESSDEKAEREKMEKAHPYHYNIGDPNTTVTLFGYAKASPGNSEPFVPEYSRPQLNS